MSFGVNGTIRKVHSQSETLKYSAVFLTFSLQCTPSILFPEVCRRESFKTGDPGYPRALSNPNIGALILRIGFGVYYTIIIIIRNPPKPYYSNYSGPYILP